MTPVWSSYTHKKHLQKKKKKHREVVHNVVCFQKTNGFTNLLDVVSRSAIFYLESLTLLYLSLA